MILALGFLALFSVFVPKLLDLGSTNLLATSRLQEERTIVYVADGATDGAIQYLRANTNCGRPINGSCPGGVSDFRVTANSMTAITTWAFAGQAIDYDRTLTLTTTVAGVTRVIATVVIRDANPGSGPDVPVDVASWKYVR
jgi:hypothetical protein